MQLDVTVQIEGEDVLAGRLYQNVRHGDETATFSYAASYLDDAHASPSLWRRTCRSARGLFTPRGFGIFARSRTACQTGGDAT